MVLNYYNLEEQPFGVSPDPRYLYLGPSHREALASLVYGIQNGCGFLSLIASPGMGKTTLLRYILERFQPNARVVFLSRTLRTAEHILPALLYDLGVHDEGLDALRMDFRLNELLLAEASQGRRVILMIDEAQNLDDSALELVRLLSNFETGTKKLIQIILAGQPQLWERLASPQLLQLRQRMSMISRLEPFDAEDTRRYIAQRLRAAGYGSSDPLFTPEAEALIAKHGGGIPRNINNVCFNALCLGYVLKQNPIRRGAVLEALTDLKLAEQATPIVTGPQYRKPVPAFFPPWRKFAAVSALVLVALLLTPGIRRNLEAGDSQAASADEPAAAARDSKPPSIAEGLREPAAARGDASESVRPPAPPAFSRDLSTSGPPRYRTTGNPGVNARTSLDPAKLWQQVRREDTNAEVTLARMYLEGMEVPRNCQQARVLLLAASKRGNTRAVDVLNNDADSCH